MATCQVCAIHAESVFKIEGMDCHEEVAILERRLKSLTGLEALQAARDEQVATRLWQVSEDLTGVGFPLPARAPGAADHPAAR